MREQRLRRALLPLGLAVLLPLVAVLIVGRTNGGVQADKPAVPLAAMQRMLMRVPQRANTLGRQTAPVTVTEFADLQCPYCETYTLRTLPTILQRWVGPGEVKMILHPVSFLGEVSSLAARAAIASGYQNRLWNFADAFFYYEGRENSGYVTEGFLRRVGSAVPGLDVTRMMADRRSSETVTELRAVTAAAKTQHVNSTPTFIVARSGRGAIRVVGSSGLQSALEQMAG